MPRLQKDEKRTELIIRGLLRQPENRRCINCDSLGPQYVCTTFWTFVCTSCSGVHREFSHRVKSVSMAKFNEEELAALQAGGNERAREIYFKAWDPQHNSLPDNSNLHSLREFIKLVYKDRRYAGANNPNSLSVTDKQDSRDSYYEQSSRGVRNDFLKRLSFDRTSSSGRDKVFSPTIRDKKMDFKNIFEERSSRNIQETPRSARNRSRSTIQFEIVDNRFREDGSVKHHDRRSNKGSRSESSSPASQRGTATKLPAVHPAKDLLGEKAPRLIVDETPKDNVRKDADDSARGQKTDDGTLPVPHDAKQGKNKTENPSTLIDFDATPERSQNKSEPEAGVTASNMDDENSWVTPSTIQTVANDSIMNSLESLFLDWPVASSDSTSEMHTDATSGQPNSTATDVGTDKTPAVCNSPRALANTVTPNEQQWRSNSQDFTVQMDQIHHLFLEQQNQAFECPSESVNSYPPQGATSVEVFNDQMQLVNYSSTSNDQEPHKSVPLEKSLQAFGSKDWSTTSGRKELPQFLFTSHFEASTPAVGGWQYGMQFQSPAMPVAPFVNPSGPRNPFAFGDNRFQVQAANFPSMSPRQGALPSMPVSAAFGYQPSPYATGFASHHMPQYGMSMTQVPGAYMGQLPNNVPPTRPQGNADFGRSEDAFVSLNPNQQARGPNSFFVAPTFWASRGGNPFG